MKVFEKNDNGFICEWCGKTVKPLGYTSRDHCPRCLTSLHVDVNPGDRENDCRGLMVPVAVSYKGGKGYVIEYKCSKCGQRHNNKAAEDDNFSTILAVMNESYILDKFKKVD